MDIAAFCISILSLFVAVFDVFKDIIREMWLKCACRYDIVIYPAGCHCDKTLNAFSAELEAHKLNHWFDGRLHGLRLKGVQAYGANLTRSGRLAFKDLENPFLHMGEFDMEFYDCCNYYVVTCRGRKKIRTEEWFPKEEQENDPK